MLRKDRRKLSKKATSSLWLLSEKMYCDGICDPLHPYICSSNSVLSPCLNLVYNFTPVQVFLL